MAFDVFYRFLVFVFYVIDFLRILVDLCEDHRICAAARRLFEERHLLLIVR